MLLAQTTSDAASTGLGIGLLLVYLVVGLALLAFHIYVIVDILKYSDADWQRTGQNKGLWIALWVITLCCGFSLILDLVWWFGFRPKMQGTA